MLSVLAGMCWQCQQACSGCVPADVANAFLPGVRRMWPGRAPHMCSRAQRAEARDYRLPTGSGQAPEHLAKPQGGQSTEKATRANTRSACADYGPKLVRQGRKQNNTVANTCRDALGQSKHSRQRKAQDGPDQGNTLLG